MTLSTVVIFSLVLGIFGLLPSNLTNFAAIATSTITNTGNAVVNGDLGLYPGTSITGFPPGILNGVRHVTNGVAQQAQLSLVGFQTQLSNFNCTGNLTGQDLGGMTLAPGVYCFASDAAINGNLMLDSKNQTSPLWIFQIVSSFLTASTSQIIFTALSAPCNVFWNVGTSATLGSASIFQGVLSTGASITLGTTVAVTGKLLSRVAVTLAGNVLANCTEIIPTPTFCFGKSSTDPQVCNGTGTCVSNNTCSCNTNYFGSQCSNFACYSIASTNSSSVCNGNGACSSPNNCICNAQYTGNQCQTPICFTRNATDPQVCNGNGACNSPNNCSCNAQFTGNQCQNPVCYTKSSTDPQVCNANGNCSSPNNCVCNAQFTGPQCQSPVCYTRNATDPQVCNGNGICSSPNNCTCNVQYTGNQCQTPICFTRNATDPQVCNGNGTCNSPNNCVCNSRFSGAQCQSPTCYARNSTDPLICSGNGNCTSPNNCVCNSQSTGNQCQVSTCFSRNSTDPQVCSGNGNCNSPNICTCSVQFNGTQCQFPNCYKTSGNDLSVCGGQGNCTSPDNCMCNSQYSGSQCQSPICFSRNSIDPMVCNGNGACSSPNNCICNSQYNGTQCQNPVCYSIDSSNTNVCNGRGACASPNNCVCQSPFSGAQCQNSCANDISSFAILAASTITSAGPTIITGDVGLSPGVSITGFGPGIINGNQFVANPVAQNAQLSLIQRYLQISKIACGNLLTGQDLGGMTLKPGVYCFATTAQLTGTLTLDSNNDLKANWIFQVGTTLTTSINSKIVFINGALPCNVFWNVGSSATLGATSTFFGNILAYASISVNTGASITGKLLAQNGAVTLISNTVTNCAISCSTTCNGKSPTDPTVCGGAGACVFPGYCACQDGRNGTDCSTITRVNSSTSQILSILLALSILLIF